MKLPAPITDVPGKSTSKPKAKNLATLLNMKQFHIKPIKKLPKRNNNKQEDTTSSPIPDISDTPLDTISSALPDSLDSLNTLQDTLPDTISSMLMDSLDNPSLDTPILLNTPIQEVQDWCILDSTGMTDELLFLQSF